VSGTTRLAWDALAIAKNEGLIETMWGVWWEVLESDYLIIKTSFTDDKGKTGYMDKVN
jgi:hypothetical protein